MGLRSIYLAFYWKCVNISQKEPKKKKIVILKSDKKKWNLKETVDKI